MKNTRIALIVKTLVAASPAALARDHSGPGAASGHAAASVASTGRGTGSFGEGEGGSNDPDNVYSASENYSEHSGSGAIGSPSVTGSTAPASTAIAVHHSNATGHHTAHG